MGCRIIVGTDEYGDGAPAAVFYCSTTAWAFGPVMYEQPGVSALKVAQMFLTWLPDDPRATDLNKLESLYYRFLTETFPRTPAGGAGVNRIGPPGISTDACPRPFTGRL